MGTLLVEKENFEKRAVKLTLFLWPAMHYACIILKRITFFVRSISHDLLDHG